MKRASKVATEGSYLIKSERNHRNWKGGDHRVLAAEGYSADLCSGRHKTGAGQASPQSWVNKLLGAGDCCHTS